MSVFSRWMVAVLALASAAPAQISTPEPRDGAQMLLSTNAYDPVPSPDGKYIAYVSTGWGHCLPHGGCYGGFGRSSLVSDVELMDASGKVLTRGFAPNKFIAGWSPDSKSVLCYRDWRYAILTPGGAALETGSLPYDLGGPNYERVAYLADMGRAVWPEKQGLNQAMRTSAGILEGPSERPGSDLIAPSPDGRYLAMLTGKVLWVYSRLLNQWTNLGAALISPDQDWSYIQPSWDPWFRDSSRLVFFSGTDLVVSSPDGSDRQVLVKAEGPAGLPAASPDGGSIAYVTFQSRLATGRTDRRFWGNNAVWVVSTTLGSTPRQIAQADPETTSGLRWLGNDAVVFDRISENILAMHARLEGAGPVAQCDRRRLLPYRPCASRSTNPGTSLGSGSRPLRMPVIS